MTNIEYTKILLTTFLIYILIISDGAGGVSSKSSVFLTTNWSPTLGLINNTLRSAATAKMLKAETGLQAILRIVPVHDIVRKQRPVQTSQTTI